MYIYIYIYMYVCMYVCTYESILLYFYNESKTQHYGESELYMHNITIHTEQLNSNLTNLITRTCSQILFESLINDHVAFACNSCSICHQFNS